MWGYLKAMANCEVRINVGGASGEAVVLLLNSYLPLDAQHV